MYSQKLMMVKTVQKRHQEVVGVSAQSIEHRVRSLEVKFKDDSVGIVMVNLQKPTVHKIAVLLGVDDTTVTIEDLPVPAERKEDPNAKPSDKEE